MFSLFFNLTDKKILFAGGTPEAESLILSLLDHDPLITVLSPSATENIKLFHRMGRIDFDERWAEKEDITSCYYFIFAVTGDAEVDAEIATYAREKNIPVFIASAPDTSDFSFVVNEEEDSFNRIKRMLNTKKG